MLALCALLAVAPARAQFGNIFNDGPPRPPADVPPPPGSGPGYYPSRDYPDYDNPPPRNYPTYPRPPGAVRSDAPPAEPLPAPMNLPPQARPGGGTIQSQPLAPPPGTEPKQQANAPAQQQQQLQQQHLQQQQQQVQPLSPVPGQRPPPTNANTNQQQDEVVQQPPPQRIANPTAVFAGLDKITGRIIKFDVAINETVQFGALQVTPRVCYSRPPTESPQTDSFVEVDEVTLQGEIKRIFTGWMFAASPGLHAVEHPIYDVWLTDCKGGNNPAVADIGAEDQAKAPPPKPKAQAKPPAKKPPVASQRGALPPIR